MKSLLSYRVYGGFFISLCLIYHKLAFQQKAFEIPKVKKEGNHDSGNFIIPLKKKNSINPTQHLVQS